jgi:hypothetical protein
MNPKKERLLKKQCDYAGAGKQDCARAWLVARYNDIRRACRLKDPKEATQRTSAPHRARRNVLPCLLKIISGRNGAAAQAKLAWLQSLEPARKKHVLEPVRTFIVRWHKTPDGRVDRTTSNLSFFPGMKPVASENLIVTAASDEIRT